MKIDNSTQQAQTGGTEGVFDLNLRHLSATEDRVFRAQAGFTDNTGECVVTTVVIGSLIIC